MNNDEKLLKNTQNDKKLPKNTNKLTLVPILTTRVGGSTTLIINYPKNKKYIAIPFMCHPGESFVMEYS